MLNGPEGDFRVDIDVHLERHGDRVDGTEHCVVVVRNDFGKNETVSELDVAVPSGSNIITVSLIAFKDAIELWWPGKQRLYNLKVAFRSGDYQTEWVHKKIGFRTCALVTVKDVDEALIYYIIRNKSEGSGSHGMFSASQWRVNLEPRSQRCTDGSTRGTPYRRCPSHHG